MALIPKLLLVLLISGIILVVAIKTDKSGLKFMLLGISLILFGGIIEVQANSDLKTYEFLFLFSGLILSLIGFVKKN